METIMVMKDSITYDTHILNLSKSLAPNPKELTASELTDITVHRPYAAGVISSVLGRLSLAKIR